MKAVMLLLISVFSASSFASSSTFKCSLESNPHHTALVAGESFEISTDDGFGYNGFFQNKVVIKSEYLCLCEGIGAENMNPLAEGPAGVATVTGSQCAADGFDVYLSSGVSGIVQVGTEAESIYYSCSKK